MAYLEENAALAMDVLTLLNPLKLNIEFKLKIDTISLNNTKCFNNKNDGDNENSIAYAPLKEVSGAAYSRLTSKIIKPTNIDPNVFPSHYELTLPCPKI